MVVSIRPPRADRADRILVIRLGALGDVVRTLPSIQRLRAVYPGAHLAWLVEPDSAGVVDAAKIVDETLVFPRRVLTSSIRAGDGLSFGREASAFLRMLRSRRFELTVDFHGILKSGMLAWASGARIRVGYARGVAREGAWLFANQRVALASTRTSRFERNDALVRALDPSGGASELTGVQLGPSALAEARLAARLRSAAYERSSDLVLIHPGSSRGASHKRYAPSAWADVVRRLAASGVDSWIIAGANRHERALQEHIIRESGGGARPAPETRTFDDLLALLARAAVFASGDTGPLHAASILGVPVVQLLGPTDPVHNLPWSGAAWRRVHSPLPCSPCRRGCADPACMRVLPPAIVAREILTLYRSAVRRRASSSDAPR